MIKKNQNLPKTTGVYLFKKSKEILYIGKAVDIKERVKNHFQSIRPSSWQATSRDSLFMDKVTQVGFIKTNSEIEALILEANLIKKYRPKYNIVWKDDKNYFYVGATQEDFPRIFLTHQLKIVNKNLAVSENLERSAYSCKLKISYIGPFVDGESLKQTLKILRKAFPYRSCNKISKHSCLWYHLQRCPAPCLLKSPLSQQIDGFRKSIIERCQKNAKNLIEILQGRKVGVLEDLKKEMEKYSILQDFEKAAKTRDQIEALEKVLSHAKIFKEPQIQKETGDIKEILKSVLKTKKEINRIEAYDISNIQGEAATGSMVTFIRGIPDKSFYRKFKIHISGKPNDVAMIKEILLRRFKHPEWPYPDLILIDGGKAQLNVTIETKNKKQKTKNIFAVALAKKKNELFVENRKKPILLKKLPREIFNLILQLRDEAHRFARKYHHKLRKIDTFG